MKKLIFPLFAAIALLASSTEASAQDRPEGRNDNYGFDKTHQVTPEERAQWEAAHKDGRRADRKDDRKDERKDDRKVARKDDRKDDRKKDDRKDERRDDRKDKDFNYGFDKNHQVTPQERARWEEAHKNGNGR